MKKRIIVFLAAMCIAACVCACQGASGKSAASAGKDDGRLNVVCTIFPQYDFVRQIAGDKVNLTMLLKPGAESHSYEPTPQDIIKLQDSDMFVYVGGDSDEWVKSILSSMNTDRMTQVKLMDCVDLKEEETVEGMQPEKEESCDAAAEGPEMDEHVWTSVANSEKIVQKLSDTLIKLDPDNKDYYEKNTKTYLDRLKKLDGEFHSVIDSAKRREIIVGDRFPFMYFCREYGLKYYAAFPGCSTDTEADPATVAFLTDKVKQDKIPVVFHIELSNGQMCNSICDATGARAEPLNAVHNVSADDFKAGVTYVDLMEHNVKVLKEALN